MPEQEFFVTSLGECLRGDALIEYNYDLSRKEWATSRKIHRLQAAVNSSRFRVYGGIRRGKPDKNGLVWTTGPDHGRPQRQIEMWWDVTDVTLPSLRRLIKRLKTATQDVWKKAGVSVC